MKNTSLLPALAALLLPLSTFADTEVVDGITWTYTILDGKASVGGGSSTSRAVAQTTSGSITIPSSLGGYPVTSIGAYAFYFCSRLTSITISSSVISIGDSAFECCSSLTSVTMPGGVTSIGNYAFYGCSGLRSITIPDGVTSIGSGVFYGCSGMTSITIGAGLTSLNGIPTAVNEFHVSESSETFSSIDGVLFSKDGQTLIRFPEKRGGDYSIPNGPTSIGNSAFSGCSELTSVTVPDGVTSLGNYAFSGCSGLTSVTIPNSVTSIGGFAFDNCSELKTIIASKGLINFPSGVHVLIPDGVTTIGDADFSNCPLSSITIPNSVTTIGGYAFYRCSGLQSITIPDSVVSIGSYAFSNCSGLTSIIFPDTITSIGVFALSGCSNLSQVLVPANFEGSVDSLGVSSTIIVRYEQHPIATFDGNGGNVAIDQLVCSFNEPYGELPVPTKTGFSFSSWTLCGAMVGPENIVAPTNHLLVAKWTPNEYTVLFDAAGGEWEGEAPTKVVTFGELYGELPVPSKAGHSCSWTLGGEPVSAENLVIEASDHTLVAVWSPNDYSVSFDAVGGSVEPASKMVTFDTAYGELPVPTKRGHSFSGWSLDGDAVNATTIMTTPDDHTLVATWSPNEYTVSFDAAGGAVEPSSKTVTFNAVYGELPVPVKRGHSFAGWYLDGDAVNAATVVATPNNHTLVATWTPNDYTVFFDAAGGEWEGDTPDKIVTFGSIYGELPVPTLANSTFARWLLGGEVVDSNTIVTTACNHTLVASWSDWMIHFDANGGEGIMVNQPLWLDQPATTISTNRFTRDGFFFLGWALAPDGEAVLLDGDSTSEIEAEAGETITLYAVWRGGAKRNVYALRFNENGGEFVPKHGLVAKYYDIASVSDSIWYQQVDTYDECIAYHAAMTPTIVTNTADIGDALDFGDNNNGNAATFHGKYAQYGTENFVLLLEGIIACSEGGTYSFQTRHDDGCVVYLDGRCAYSRATATSGRIEFSVNLSSGEHEIVIAMHEGGGGQCLQFQMKGPSDFSYSGLPQSVLFPSFYDAVATALPKRIYARGDAVNLPNDRVSRTGYSLTGWATTPDGPVVYPAAETLANGVAASNGETVDLYAVWTANEYTATFDADGGEIAPIPADGLDLRYYDIPDEDYWTWSESETALTNYFASRIATIETNTLDFGDSLDPGIAGVASSSVSSLLSWGMNGLRFEANGTTNRFHGKYAQKDQENIAVYVFGEIGIEEPGAYSFACIADDYEAIFIDGQRVCCSQWDSVGSGSISLSAGFHRFSMGFSEGGGGHGFAVQWKKPGGTAWSPLPQSVLWSSQRSRIPDSKAATFDAAYGELPTVSRTGYTFAEWTIDGVGITAETICTQPSNHVIVAAWTPNGYEVSFDPTGGTVSPTAKVVTFDAAYGELPTPACEGYVFLDWRLDGAAVDAATIVQTAEDYTLSARWGVAVGNGVWEEMIGDEPIVLGAPEFAPTGAVEIPAEIAGRPVVAIGADAFAGNTAVTAITIPASVTNIADGAFAGCTGLRRVEIGGGWADRLANLFPDAAEGIEEVGFLDGVTAVPDNFFEGCTALRTMDIAESVVDIGTNVFEACSALETVVSNGLEICDGWVLGMASGATAPADLAIPDGVRGIAAFAFDGEGGIGTLALPESLRFIGAGAFRNCTGLEGIAVPEVVWKIDREAFRNCTYAQGLALGEGIVEIGDGAFANCSMLMGAEVSAGVETIGENCFSNCWRMLSVSIPQSVERIGAGAFADCRRLAGATVPLHVAPMSELFPAAYSNLATITVSPMPADADEAFVASRQMVPDVFAGCAALEGIELPPWVCNVADGAFEGCAAMDEIAFPDAVTNIGARACASMAALEAVAFPAGLVAIGEGALSNCAAVASLALPDGLRTIGERAFDGLALLARADVPGSVRAIGDGAFAGCAAIRAVAMPGDAGTVAAVFPDCYADIVSATVVAETDGAGAPLPVVMDGLFEGCAALTRVELPQDLAEIGAGAFADCAALTEIGIPAAVTNIGAAAFAGCSTLSSIALPKNLEVLEDRTFQGCASMAEIIVPESVRALGTAVFDGCTLLRSVRFVGNAPDYATADGGPYAGVPAGAKSYVANGSMGWDGIPTSRALPEYWPAGTTYEIDFWTPNRCAVSFDANYEGAGEPAEVEQVTGTSYVLPADPVRPGARFGGWWTAPENGARITASTQVTATRPHTFYAHWTMNRYFVHFDASGGSGTADPVEMTVGTPAALPACPFVKVAHDFAGWATEPGGEAVYADGAEVMDLAYAQNAAVTLYAVWRSRDWTLADYLDAPTLDFETSGGGAWSPDWQDAKAGGVSLRCDGLPPAAEGGTVEAALRTTVTGAGTLAFWWKVSCEENDEQYDDWFDYATFAIDGAEVSRIAGDSGWVRVESAVTGAGEHGLVWTFTRDDYDEDGADWENALWVDGIEWTPAPVTLTFAGGGAAEGSPPAAVVKYEGYALSLPGPGTLADPPRVFAGWTDGESVYAPGATYVFGSADAVLTAVWTLQTWTLSEAVDAPALVFATGGDADWAVDTTAGWTNGVSAKSGSVTNSQASWIETTVSGAGTLSFRWKVLGGIYRNNPFAYAKVETNGAVAAQTHLTDGWEEQTVEVSGAGTHTIRWTYLRTSARTADGDCAWLDGVAWTPAGAASVVVEGVEIPIAWLDEVAASIVAASGGDYAAAAEAPAANGVNEVWECYVAGLDPTNAASRLLATIDMVDGEPAIRWTPDLNEGGTKHERDYVVEGKTNLVDRSWGPTNEATRFFRVKVEMP